MRKKRAGTQRLIAMTDLIPHTRKGNSVGKHIKSAASRLQFPAADALVLTGFSRILYAKKSGSKGWKWSRALFSFWESP